MSLGPTRSSDASSRDRNRGTNPSSQLVVHGVRHPSTPRRRALAAALDRLSGPGPEPGRVWESIRIVDASGSERAPRFTLATIILMWAAAHRLDADLSPETLAAKSRHAT